jgi:hypothetical protein
MDNHDYLLTNQVGYIPADPGKRVLILDANPPRGFGGDYLFEVFDPAAFSDYALNSQAQRESHWYVRARPVNTPFGSGLEADLAGLDKKGVYKVVFGSRHSPLLVVRDDVYCRVLQKTLQGIRIQRCGDVSVGYHDLCHLDDAVRSDTGDQVTAVGGWHDAGDLRKWISLTAFNSICLLESWTMWGKQAGALGIDPEALRREALWGHPYFSNLFDTPNGAVLGSVATDDNLVANRWTDNVPRSGDERVLCVKTGLWSHLAGMMACAPAIRVLAESDPQESARTANLMDRAHRWLKAQPMPETATLRAMGAWLYADLFRSTGAAEYRDEALSWGRALLELQQVGSSAGQSEWQGFFYHDVKREHSDLGGRSMFQGLPALALCRLVRHVTTGIDRTPFADALRLHCDFMLQGQALNAFALMPFALYLQEPQGYQTRPLTGGWRFRYFTPPPINGLQESPNATYLSRAAALAEAADLLDQPAYAWGAVRLLEWVLGRNPFAACFMTGEGVRNPDPYSPVVGPIPGCVMAGIGGTAEDQPRLSMSGWQYPGEVEYCSPNVAFMHLAISTLEHHGANRRG